MLALALGKYVWQIEREMPMTELQEWAMLYIDEPFGDTRADIRAGIIASTISRAAHSIGNAEAKPIDFMPIVKRAIDSRQQAPSEISEAFMRAASGLKLRKIKRKGKG